MPVLTYQTKHAYALVINRCGIYKDYNNAVGALKNGAQEKRLAHPTLPFTFLGFLHETPCSLGPPWFKVCLTASLPSPPHSRFLP
jgi:hypothetical protein